MLIVQLECALSVKSTYSAQHSALGFLRICLTLVQRVERSVLFTLPHSLACSFTHSLTHSPHSLAHTPSFA